MGKLNLSCTVGNKRLAMVLALLSVLLRPAIYGQTTSNFTIAPGTCLNAPVSVNNQSTNATGYVWDFCQNDLKSTPTVALSQTATGGNSWLSIRQVYDQGNWYVFLLELNSNRMVRLNYGSDLNSTPTISDVGNLSGKMHYPISFDFIQENNVWYAVVVDNFNSLERLRFGNGLSVDPDVVDVLSNIGTINSGFNLRLVRSDTQVLAFISNFSGNSINVVNFDNSIMNTPVSNKLIGGAVGLQGPWGLSIIRSGNNWYGMVGSANDSKVYWMDFGSDPYATPTFTVLKSGLTQVVGIELFQEGLEFYAIARGRYDGLYRFELGGDLTSPVNTTVALGNFGLLTADSWCMSLVRFSPDFVGATVDFSSGKVNSIRFQGTCSNDVTLDYYKGTTFPDVRYKKSGTFRIDLDAIASSLNRVSSFQTTVVQNAVGPQLDFSSNSICKNTSAQFSSSDANGQTLVSWNWDLGNSQTSTSANPATNYSSTGDYVVSLSASAANGCVGTLTKTITIYDPPVADFTAPNGLVCTNNLFTFTNTTAGNFNGNLSYQWLVNGSAVSNTRDLNYAFATQGDQSVQLTSALPGCSSQVVKTVSNVQSGPVSDFTIAGICESDTTRFTNTSSGSIASYAWDFGNGHTSTAVNDYQIYAGIGAYSISLVAIGTNGCKSTTTKSQTIYTHPQPNFSLSLPPFSCSGSPSQFNDLTPNPNDSNLSSWFWDFNDSGSAQPTSIVRNAQHTYAVGGNYNVSLTVTSNFGCKGNLTKMVTITQGPVADFTSTPACEDQGTHFSDASTGQIQTWSWKIENTYYTINNPIHVFGTPGVYPVQLTVATANNCSTTITRNVTVASPLQPDFSYTKNCVNQQAMFNDITDGTVDPIASWQWTFGSAGTAVGNPGMFEFSATGTVSTTLNVTGTSGCVYSKTKDVLIVNAPNALFTATPDAGIPPLTVVFTNKSTDATHYRWDFNDPANSQSILVSPTFTFTDGGDHVVDLTAFNDVGCSSVFSKLIRSFVPANALAVVALNKLVNNDGTVTVVVALKNVGNTVLTDLSMEMDLGGAATVREKITETINPNTVVNHLLGYDFADTTNLHYFCVSVPLAGDADVSDNEKCMTFGDQIYLFTPHPNPANDNLLIQWMGIKNKQISIALLDALGQPVFNEQFTSLPGSNELSLDTSLFQAGLYVLIIRENGQETVKKVAITH